MSFSTKQLTGYAPFKKGTDEIAWDYHFNRAGSNGNDNGVFLVFDDQSLHDAEISLRRYDKGLAPDFEMRRVEIKIVPLTSEDEEYKAGIL